ncbi:MAG: hypothetical protein LAP85_12480 [Acidobacteriia bacterium]|nr:hypothetical protein [Terriglobia bacterium]
MAQRKVRITFNSDVSTRPQGLPPEYEILEVQPRLWQFRVRGALGPLMALLAGMPVLDVDISEARLEEVLMRYYREERA